MQPPQFDLRAVKLVIILPRRLHDGLIIGRKGLDDGAPRLEPRPLRPTTCVMSENVRSPAR